MATPFGSRPTFTSSNRSGTGRDVSTNVTVLLSGFATARSSPSAESASGCDDVEPEKPPLCLAGIGCASRLKASTTPMQDNVHRRCHTRVHVREPHFVFFMYPPYCLNGIQPC